jgi:hypothetical protein
MSRTSKPISIKRSTSHPWVKGILNCSNKGPDPLQREDNHKNANIWRGYWKICFLENHWDKIAHICMKAFWHSADLSLYKLYIPCASRTPLSTSNTSLPRFMANGRKPKYAQMKKNINFSCNNSCKYINTNLSVTRKALICTLPNIL